MKNSDKAQAILHNETDKAVCISFDWGDRVFKKVWLPKSQIEIVARCSDNINIDVRIPFWLIKKLTPTDFYNGNSNSVWVSIFNGQDKNGLTEYGYTL